MNAKTLLRLILILALAASVVAIVMRQNSITKLRAENQSLLNDANDAERLAQENQEIKALRKQNAEVVALHAANKDLPRLRNEVGQLRKKMAEMAALRADNQQFEQTLAHPPAASPQVVKQNLFGLVFTKASLKDVGLSLPINTLETAFAAACQGDIKRLKECGAPDFFAIMNDKPEEKMREDLLKEMDKFIGYEVINREQTSPEQVTLQVKMSNNDSEQTVPLKFRQIGNEWRLDK